MWLPTGVVDACALALVLALVNGQQPSEHVLLGRCCMADMQLSLLCRPLHVCVGLSTCVLSGVTGLGCGKSWPLGRQCFMAGVQVGLSLCSGMPLYETGSIYAGSSDKQAVQILAVVGLACTGCVLTMHAALPTCVLFVSQMHTYTGYRLCAFCLHVSG